MPYQKLRFYLENSAPPITPSAPLYNGVGDPVDGSQQILRKLAAAKNPTSNATKSVTGMAGSNTPWRAIRFVSDPVGLTAPAVVAGLVYRSSTDVHVPGSPPSVREMRVSMNLWFVSNDGATRRVPNETSELYSDSGDIPPIYFSSPYRLVDNTDLITVPVMWPLIYLVPVSGGLVPQWDSIYPNYINYVPYPSVVPTDRLVVDLLCYPQGGSSRAYTVEYGDGAVIPFDLDPYVKNNLFPGWPFFDLFILQATNLSIGNTDGQYARPIRPTHRPERFSQPPTPDVPFLEEVFLGE